MNRFQEMSVFLAVAEARSFAAAARRLAMSAPAVTRSVSALERRLGALLLVRTTRSLRLTEAGERYAQDCRRILEDVDQADDAAAGAMAAPRGSLHITAPSLFGELHVMPAVLGYLREHREVSVRALLVDRVVNLLDEGVDVAVRIGALPDSSLTAIAVGHVRRVVCASPAFLQRFGKPDTPDALAQFCTITAAMEGRGPQWRFLQDGQPRRLPMASQLTVTSFQGAIKAACEDWGLTQVVSYQVARHLASGALQVVLRDYELPPIPVHVVYPEGRKSSAKVRSFVDFCVDALRRDLAALPG
ncbi:HTH-type transcriptional regulator PgrR [Achromobacter deleyi]|uniref:HTH-type transcriptional regulator PgrR n=2 Tax=Achromobacter deleyi TaxID=1353891 RepID=A0A6S6ZKX6_9BURK|nr:LysR family transcriptional regulator [Achromobacter deleyi]CAB3685104.1 HTH-type transcriptional regulator PgrR [Achromobacter deleyi]CAB3867146.1 HTH-type transcriptional regulator PgrR [Achromobacter deleyi]CAB3910974.1 HTH-type transcriptional regulator PgrR [Achromobacter deleyi]